MSDIGALRDKVQSLEAIRTQLRREHAALRDAHARPPATSRGFLQAMAISGIVGAVVGPMLIAAYLAYVVAHGEGSGVPY